VLAAAGTAAALLLAAGCGSSVSGGTSGAASSGPARPAQTITIGVLTDVTGVLSATDKSSVDGVRAGTYYAARNGYTLRERRKITRRVAERRPSACYGRCGCGRIRHGVEVLVWRDPRRSIIMTAGW
jgi:hypothetical protein